MMKDNVPGGRYWEPGEPENDWTPASKEEEIEAYEEGMKAMAADPDIPFV